MIYLTHATKKSPLFLLELAYKLIIKQIRSIKKLFGEIIKIQYEKNYQIFFYIIERDKRNYIIKTKEEPKC